MKHERDAFVFYSTAWDTVQEFRTFDKALGDELLEAIISYGLDRDYKTDNPLIRGAMSNIVLSIDKASERHAKAAAGGKKTAAKTKIDRNEIYALADNGKTQSEIAEIMGCSTKTIQRALKERTETGQDILDKCPEGDFVY